MDSTNSELEVVPLHDVTGASSEADATPAVHFSAAAPATPPRVASAVAAAVGEGVAGDEPALQSLSTEIGEEDYVRTSSRGAIARAQFEANPGVRVVRRLGHNALNKLEDIGIGLLGVTGGITDVGEGVGRSALSGVGAVGYAVQAGVVNTLTGLAVIRLPPAREVDTVKEVDISGTILKDLNRAIEVEQLKGTSNAESPLNTPWILMVVPMLPIVFMYTKTAMAICVPPILRAVIAVWFFVGWRLWLCLAIAFMLTVVIAWESVKAIEPLRQYTMLIDVEVIKFRRKIVDQSNKQMPKIYKVVDRILPPLRSFLLILDGLLSPRLGYSPLLAFKARFNGWIYDPRIRDVTLGSSSSLDSTAAANGKTKRAVTDASETEALVRDGGHSRIVVEEGVEALHTSLEFDPVAARAAASASLAVQGAGELFEEFFQIDLHLANLSELHREYTSVWVEWIYRGMVVDRSVIRDIGTSSDWNGFGASFDGCVLRGEVRLPLQADTTVAKGGFHDEPIRLVLKGRDGLPLYSNDGARRYMRDSPTTKVIGEIELSALKIGVGTYSDGIVRSELRVPMHAVGVTQYRAAVLHASTRIQPVDSSSYSYRQMLSPLPNGEWTVRVNVFELRNLRGVDDSGSSDPYVSVGVMGMVKRTDRQRQTLSCMVNQLLFFSKVCTGLEFEDEKIVIQVMDWNRFSAPQIIGVYTLDAKRMLELPGQELYRKWFALQDPKGDKNPAGFIKLSITVVRPGGSPPQHDDTEDREEFSSATLLKNTVLRAPKMSYENWGVHITIGWADMLPCMSSGYRDAIRGYITLSYSGYPECRTKTFIAEAKEVIDPNIGDTCLVASQRRVIWNEEYILPLTIINGRVAQEGIQLKMYHRTMPRLDDPFRGDLLIGQVNVSFEELFRNTATAVVRGQMADGEDEGDRIRNIAMMKPRYYNFYGKPSGEADPYDKGIAFRGRVLIGVAAKPGEVSSPFLRPCPPPPRPRLEFYKLDFCVLQATELPLHDGWSVSIEGRIGLHKFGHTIPNAVVEKLCVHWDENCAVSIPNLQFPEDVEQIPDLFITLSARKSLTVAELEERESPEQEEENVLRMTPPVSGDNDGDSAKRVSGAGSDGQRADGGSVQGRAPMLASDESTNAHIEWSPKAFLRLPAKHLICSQTDPRWMFMDFPGNNVLDSDENQVPGSILISVSLSKYDPTAPDPLDDEIEPALPVPGKNAKGFSPIKKDLMHTAEEENDTVISTDLAPSAPADVEDETVDITESGKNMLGFRRSSAAVGSNTFGFPLGPKRSFTLRAYIVQGRNLPAADESGLSDPTVLISMGNQSEYGRVICRQTVSPLWEDLIEVKDITIRDGERKPNVNVLVYDYDEENKPMEYLGRAIISSAELDVAPPSLEFAKWYPVFSVNPGVIVGEILADFQLIPTDLAIVHPMQNIASPSSMESTLRISLVGLRDVKFLKYAAGEIFVECCISCRSGDREKSKRGAILQHRAYEANCNVLDVLMLDISIPDDLRLAPALTVQVYAEYTHSPKPDLIATSCINLEKWLSEHQRKLLTGESLIDDSFGMDSPVPERLIEDGRYKFLKRAKRVALDNVVDSGLPLHEVKAHDRSEKKNLLVLQEKAEVLRVGFSEKDNKEGEKKALIAQTANSKDSDSEDMGRRILAPIRAVKYKVADAMADLMPDVAMILGIEVDEDVPLSTLIGPDNDSIDYDGTKFLKQDRGFCPVELEAEFSEPAYGEFLLFRGDNRSLGNTTGRMDQTTPGHTRNFPPVFPLNEAPSHATLVKREKRRTALEGSRPAVGKVKARLDLIEVDAKNKSQVKKARLASLRSFGRVFVPTEVVVRVYILRGINLQQIGPACNPYLTVRFYGGYPDFKTTKHDPVMDDDNPNFFQMFESRVKMPGGAIRIGVKDRMMPEVTLPVAYPKFLEGGGYKIGLAQKDIPVNIGKLGLGWSETIGETMIDLDARWYNSAWRSLARTPVEMRSLFSEESANLKGHLEMFVDIFDADEVEKRPKLYRPIPISKPRQENYELRVVIYKIRECYLPYQLVNYDPVKLASFYVEARLGNRTEDVRRIDPPCKYVGDGVAEFNWRMKWKLKLPSLEIKPRLKLQIYDDTSFGVGDDQLCAVSDIKLRSLFDEIVTTKVPILKKKQWIVMHHPNYPEVASQLQISLELTTEEVAMKKACGAGPEGWKETTQHQDYVLPLPFQPAAFSLYNPVPYFSYLIFSTIKNLQLSLVTVLLVFPFLPMFFQFVFMLTPWTWYAAGGVAGLMVFIRVTLVSSARAARMQAETRAARDVLVEKAQV